MRGTLTLAALAAVVFLCSVVQVAWADPAAVKLRAGDIFSDERAAVAADGPVGSVAIVAARNGSFSGRVLVSSAETIKGLRGSVSTLKTDDGTALADRCTQVRYAVAFDDSWRRYRPGGLDVILESAPESVSPRDKGPALAAVWLTVTPAKDAKAGLYKGEMTVEAAGLPATKVPVEVTVTDWTVPAAHDWRTWVGMIQSPDSLSMEYEVPMWSEEHWKLIARSF
ncbi:MAG: hypothetical protein JXL80_08575, partial [Planctomycetes bacterium]|nr:hypothetical protein [Planctomycetota bacterium]